MANFKTHLIGATAVSGLASLSLLNLHLAKPWETGGYFLLGIVGGLLPDIDSDKSTPLTIIFYFLSLYCAFAAIFNLAVQYSFAELAVIWLAVYIAIRHVAFKVVTQMTIHRGSFHSLLAVAFFTVMVVDTSYYLLHHLPQKAWNAGLFVGMGYLVHLSLDEIYSVDLYNRRMKKSFGTALKLFSLENGLSSSLMAAILAVLFYYAPPVKAYWQQVSRALAQYHLQQKWLPQQRWFAEWENASRHAQKPTSSLKRANSPSHQTANKAKH
jgi:LexA-binding, inner membrane-associated putative hydrolase